MSKPKKKPDVADAIITRKVPFALTDTEVAMKAKALVDMEMDIEAEEQAIKDDAKNRKAELDITRAKLRVIRECVFTRKELRVVDCEREADLDNRTWRIRRKDTLEVVDLVPMTAEEVAKERQLDIAAFASIPVATEEPAAANDGDDDDSDDEDEAA